MINHLFKMPLLKINKIEYEGTAVFIYASIKSNRSKCPICGKSSKSIHDRYIRSIADLPVFQNSVTIKLVTRKFKCINTKCSKKVFSEQIPSISIYSRRTMRASKILDTLSIELTGRLGCIISNQLLIPVSCSTITRIAHGQILPLIKQPKVLGVDDWAFRKGVNYGTILIDMETSKPIDLLASRGGNDLKKWLIKYNKVEIVTRDRASTYSCAIKEICPNAIQVADRFHLLMNLSDSLDAYFKSIRGDIKKTIEMKSNELLDIPLNKNANNLEGDKQPEPFSENQIMDKNQIDGRFDIYKKVKELQAKGVPMRRISKELKISRNTVRSYFIQETLSPKTHPKSTNIELFTPFIIERLNIDGYKVKDIINEIKAIGFDGSLTQAYHNINQIKQNYNIDATSFLQIQQKPIPFINPLSSRKLAKYIGSGISTIKDLNERTYLHTLLENMPELRIVRRLVQLFKNMLANGCGNVRRWIDFIKNSKYKFSGLRTFANGLLHDVIAVENGINMKWSNGAVEGHVNRIKSIKRQMYGRASFDLLRKKVILSTSG